MSNNKMAVELALTSSGPLLCPIGLSFLFITCDAAVVYPRINLPSENRRNFGKIAILLRKYTPDKTSLLGISIILPAQHST